MARDQVVLELTEGEYTQLTNADATNIVFQCRKGEMEVRYTTDGTQPAATAAGQVYRRLEGERGDIADLVHLSGADRVWAKAFQCASALVYVDTD
jgi:hypothetical protein